MTTYDKTADKTGPVVPAALITPFNTPPNNYARYGEDLGRINFEAYTKQMGGLTYDKKLIPKWDALSPEVREAWRVGALAVLRASQAAPQGHLPSVN